MKIKFLGTSHGVPMPGRHYQSVLIETNERLYLADAGAPVMDCLITGGFDPAKVKAVFITHMHQDHMLGLVDMISLGTWYYKDMNFEVHMPKEEDIKCVRGFCEELLCENVSKNINFKREKQGVIFNDGFIKVTAFLNEHMKEASKPSFGYIIEGEGKRICITGDMHKTLCDFPAELLKQKTDFLITECAHFYSEELSEKLADINAETVAVVHVFPDEKYEKLKALKGKFDFELVFPNDGDEFII